MHLNPYKDRGWHTVEVRERWGKKVIFKIPYELTVEEIETLLEYNKKIEHLSRATVESKDFDAQAEKMREFWNYLFAQCTVIFRHYQPDVTEEYLRKHLPESVAVEITGFFENNRYYKAEQNAQVSKKKVKANDQLKSLRRNIVFMVKNGFSLLDIKKLYIDEFFNYYYELVYSLEQSKQLPEGSYDKVQGIDRSSEKLDSFFGNLDVK